jgi:protein involved in polysaccharide export with SLBB domain
MITSRLQRQMVGQTFLSALILPSGFALLFCLAGCASSTQQPAAQSDQSLATNQPATPTQQPKKDKSKKNTDLNRWLRDVDADVPPTTYRVQPPDAIRINAPGIPEIDKSDARLRPDGKISLNLLNDIYVAGLSPSEIAEELSKRLEKYYNKDAINISVDVTEFQSKKYYVFGQVYSPGVKPYTGRDTIVKVLAEAGLNEDAWPQKVVLVRPHEDPNVRQKVTIDLKQMYESGKASQNYLLEEGDLIYVPPSPLAEFRMTFEKLLAPIMPATDIAMMAMGGF